MNNFFSMIYEWDNILYLGTFSDDLYQNMLYSTVGLSVLFSSISLAAIFYYLFAQLKIPKTFHWVICLIITVLIAGLIAYFVPHTTFISSEDEINYVFTDYFAFVLQNVIYSGIYFILASMLLKINSTNGKSVPLFL